MKNELPDDLAPDKLALEDYVRALLPAELYTYRNGKLCVTAEGLACLCIGILEDQLDGDKAKAQSQLDELGIENPFPQQRRNARFIALVKAKIALGMTPDAAAAAALEQVLKD